MPARIEVVWEEPCTRCGAPLRQVVRSGVTDPHEARMCAAEALEQAARGSLLPRFVRGVALCETCWLEWQALMDRTWDKFLGREAGDDGTTRV